MYFRSRLISILCLKADLQSEETYFDNHMIATSFHPKKQEDDSEQEGY